MRKSEKFDIAFENCVNIIWDILTTQISDGRLYQFTPKTKLCNYEDNLLHHLTSYFAR